MDCVPRDFAEFLRGRATCSILLHGYRGFDRRLPVAPYCDVHVLPNVAMTSRKPSGSLLPSRRLRTSMLVIWRGRFEVPDQDGGHDAQRAQFARALDSPPILPAPHHADRAYA